eukprot:653662-Prorocentrum_minimum.AAC.1
MADQRSSPRLGAVDKASRARGERAPRVARREYLHQIREPSHRIGEHSHPHSTTPAMAIALSPSTTRNPDALVSIKPLVRIKRCSQSDRVDSRRPRPRRFRRRLSIVSNDQKVGSQVPRRRRVLPQFDRASVSKIF